MYSTVVVPLDGSPFGELALPVATRIADAHGAALHLVSVHGPLVFPFAVEGAPIYDPRFDEARRGETLAYLERTALRLRTEGRLVSVALVANEMPGTAIANEAATLDAGLVVLTTHGRGGFSRVWLGSVTVDLLRHSRTPLLVVRGHEHHDAADYEREAAAAGAWPGPRHILVPIDGSDFALRAVDEARALGEPFAPRLTLLRVVPTAASLLPYDQTFWTSAETALLDEQREHAVRETATAVERLRADGVAAEGMVVVEPDAARAILHVAAEQRADAVAMSTHARAGAARLLLGSVTDKVIRASDLPVLVVRP